jgi:ferritin
MATIKELKGFDSAVTIFEKTLAHEKLVTKTINDLSWSVLFTRNGME